MLTFYRVTSEQYEALNSKDPDGIYFLTDTKHICAGSLDYSHGVTGSGHILGGYCAGVSAYSETDNVYELTLKAVDDELDMSKFTVGAKLYFNIPNAADTENEEDLLYQKRTILGVNAAHNILTLDSSLYNANVTSLEFERCFCMVEDASRTDNATTDGDKNFVTGIRGHAHGSWNSVTGMASEASGIENIASGISSHAQGTYTTASGNSAHAEGIMTQAGGMASHAQGSNTVASGDVSFAGGTSSEASGSNSYAWGFNAKAQGNLSVAEGFSCVATGSYSTASGYRVRTDAPKSQIFGMDGTLEDTLENEGAIAFAGGDMDTPVIPFLFQMRRSVANPEYNAELDTEQTGTDSNGQDQFISNTAYRFRYAGRLQPQTLVSQESEVILDHDLYARWEVTSSAVSLSLANWEDGDRGEVVFSGELTLPEEWIQYGNMVNAYTKNILQIEKVGDQIFCQLKYKKEE